MTDDEWGLVDPARSAFLWDVGAPDFIAATIVSADGNAHLIVGPLEGLGDNNVRYQPSCPDVTHEQVGKLPIDIVKRIAIAQRMHRPKGAEE